MIEHADLAESAARRFFWPGATREDVQQEALLALWRAKPASRTLAYVVIRRHLITQLQREKDRRPQFAPLRDEHAAGGLDELVEARERLREVLATPLTSLEREAVGRAARGEPCTEKHLDNALYRARLKLRRAA